MYNLLAIALGGALGTMSRYFLNVWTLSGGYPLGTVVENMTGSLLLGLLTGYLLQRRISEWARLGLGVGFCGGFTTMSTLAADTLFLAVQDTVAHAAMYVCISLFGGLGFAFLGLLGGSWLGTPSGDRAKGRERL